MAAQAPNFFVLGGAKAGTTSLHNLLRRHPQVFMPAEKEPAYFSNDEYYARGDDWYVRTFFRAAGERRARGEATPAYLFYGDKVAPRIQRFAGTTAPKFIAIFRDPARAVYSYYWNSVREGRERLPFDAALAAERARLAAQGAELARRGRMTYAYSRIAAYASQLQPFMALFPPECFCFLLTTDLANHSVVVRQVQEFLGLEDDLAAMQPTRSNASALPRSPTLHTWLRGRSLLKDVLKPLIPRDWRYRLKLFLIGANLRRFDPPALDNATANEIRRQYREETERLQELLQRDLSDWLPA